MKTSLLLILLGVSAVSMASERPEHTSALEQYSYSMKLDIAKVTSMTDTSAVCGVTPVRMDYLDSAGKPHSLEYLVVGGGCSNG
ncbi:DUF2790 domain-containing protein [Pseudomonas sp. NA-150]|uniref:DUF2790 domain-containing protein n=1 Tax=Pseudomonas sp. NA-150 TaxID=3367525 RepID=UPI0037C87D9D